MNTQMQPRFFSQFGEDRILAKLFIGVLDGLCIEVGANDGEHGSTSLHFEQSGWKCILVEPNPDLCKLIRSRRTASLHEYAASDREELVTLHVVEGAMRADGLSTISDDPIDHARIRGHGFRSRPVQVKTRKLDHILEDAGVDQEIAFISIDVEGHEMQVLKGLSLDRWRPRILLLEDNSEFEDNSIASYLKKKGYVRFLRTGVNDWYARSDDKRFVTAVSRLRFAAFVVGKKMKRRLKSIPGAMRLRDFMRGL